MRVSGRVGLGRGRVLGGEVDVLARVDVGHAEPARLVRVEELGDEHHHRSGREVAVLVA